MSAVRMSHPTASHAQRGSPGAFTIPREPVLSPRRQAHLAGRPVVRARGGRLTAAEFLHTRSSTNPAEDEMNQEANPAHRYELVRGFEPSDIPGYEPPSMAPPAGHMAGQHLAAAKASHLLSGFEDQHNMLRRFRSNQEAITKAAAEVAEAEAAEQATRRQKEVAAARRRRGPEDSEHEREGEASTEGASHQRAGEVVLPAKGHPVSDGGQVGPKAGAAEPVGGATAGAKAEGALAPPAMEYTDTNDPDEEQGADAELRTQHLSLHSYVAQFTALYGAQMSQRLQRLEDEYSARGMQWDGAMEELLSTVSKLQAQAATGSFEAYKLAPAPEGGTSSQHRVRGQAVQHLGGFPEVHRMTLEAVAEQLHEREHAFQMLQQQDVLRVLHQGTIERHARYTTIYRQGSVAQHVHLVLDGIAHVTYFDGMGKELSRPNYAEDGGAGPVLIGLDACADAPTRLATVKVIEPVLLLSIHVDALPEATATEMKRVLHVWLLGTMRFFGELPRSMLWQMAPILTLEMYPPETVIIEQGAPGDAFYLLLKGKVAAVIETMTGGAAAFKSPAQRARSRRTSRGGRRGSDSEEMSKFVEVGTIVAGSQASYFGEMAIFDNKPRGASIVAKETTIALSLKSMSFDRLLVIIPDLRSRFDESNAALAKINKLKTYDEDWISSLVKGIGNKKLLKIDTAGEVMQERLNETIAKRQGARMNVAIKRSANVGDNGTFNFVAAEAERRRERKGNLELQRPAQTPMRPLASLLPAIRPHPVRAGAQQRAENAAPQRAPRHEQAQRSQPALPQISQPPTRHPAISISDGDNPSAEQDERGALDSTAAPRPDAGGPDIAPAAGAAVIPLSPGGTTPSRRRRKQRRSTMSVLDEGGEHAIPEGGAEEVATALPPTIAASSLSPSALGVTMTSRGSMRAVGRTSSTRTSQSGVLLVHAEADDTEYDNDISDHY